MSHTKFEYLLRFGDTTLILSQRLSEWCGKGPALEEDLALANTALDLLGHARMWLTYAGEVEGCGRDEDDLAYLRDGEDFRNLLIVERPNGNYADTLVRQFFFDAWHQRALQALVQSSDQMVADIAGKALTEVRYHLARSTDLVVRLGDGSEYSHRLMQDAVDSLWPYTGEMFEFDAIDEELVDARVAFDARSLRTPWLAGVSEVLKGATLAIPPADGWMQHGGRSGVHTQALSYLLGEMQILPRRYPGALW